MKEIRKIVLMSMIHGNHEIDSIIEGDDITKASLAFALDEAKMEDVSLHGARGLDSGAYVIVEDSTGKSYLVKEDDDDSDHYYEDDNSLRGWAVITPKAALDLIPETGDITRDAVNELRASVWNGNNHVLITPKYSMGFCSEDDVENCEWGQVIFTGSGDARYIESIVPNEGWLHLVTVESSEYAAEISEAEGDYICHQILNPDACDDRISDILLIWHSDEFDATEVFCRTTDIEALHRKLQCSDCGNFFEDCNC